MTDFNLSEHYDVANWRPVKPERFAEALLEATATVGDPAGLRVAAETLDDSRVRLVVYAECKVRDADGAPHAVQQPYLMLLGYVDGDAQGAGKPVCLEREAELAVD